MPYLHRWHRWRRCSRHCLLSTRDERHHGSRAVEMEMSIQEALKRGSHLAETMWNGVELMWRYSQALTLWDQCQDWYIKIWKELWDLFLSTNLTCILKITYAVLYLLNLPQLTYIMIILRKLFSIKKCRLKFHPLLGLWYWCLLVPVDALPVQRVCLLHCKLSSLHAVFSTPKARRAPKASVERAMCRLIVLNGPSFQLPKLPCGAFCLLQHGATV